MLSVVILQVILVIVAFYNFYWKRRKLPPGPTPLPVFGNRLTVKKMVPGYQAYMGWAKRYGPIYTFWHGEDPIVVVTDFQLIKETFIKHGDAYAGRDLLVEAYETLKGFKGIHGVLKTEGPQWQILRRFVLQVLRNLGMGRSTIEQRILSEIKLVFSDIDDGLKRGETLQNLVPLTDLAVGNIINQLAFGYRFSGKSEKEFRELKKMIHGHLIGMSDVVTQTVLSRPILRGLPVFSDAFQRFESRVNQLYGYYDRQIQKSIERLKQERKLDENYDEKEPLFVVDAFLRQMEKVKGTGDEKYFNIPNLRGVCQDLFVAGQDTMSNTLAFTMLFMILYPDVQTRMQQELDAVIGTDPQRMIVFADRKSLRYTNAVIYETQRYCNLVPHNLVHKTMRDVEINGYRIEKGTRIVPQISCVLYDEKYFEDPQVFNPKRFLDENGELCKREELIPFSIGKRQCLGETLAVMELFLFISNIFHKYQLRMEDPHNPPTLRKTPGVTVMPQEYRCRIIKRHHPSNLEVVD